MKIYLASPLGFTEHGREFLKKLKSALQKNHNVVDPWQIFPEKELNKVLNMPLSQKRKEKLKNINLKIGKANKEAIKNSELMVAVLDGPDVDSGTASEIGFAYSKGKKIIGYRSDFRLSSENKGSVVNLQVQYFIEDSGGKIVRSLSELKKELEKL